MEEALSNILLIDFIEDFPTHITIYDQDYTVLWMNRITRERKGIKPEELGRVKCYEQKGLTKPCQNCLVARVIKTGKPCESEAHEYEHADSLNDPIFWFVKAAPIRDKQGRVLGIFKVSHNITENIRTREDLDKHKTVIYDLIENSGDIIWTFTSQGIIEYSNPVIEEVLGYTIEELAAQDYSHLLHPDDLIKVMEIIPKLKKEKKGWKNLTLRWKHRDGSYRYLESNSTPILDLQGNVIAYRGVDRDVTQREELIAQLLQAQKMESVGRLAGGISHDFNNMLGVITGYLEMSSKELAPSHPVSGYLKQMKEAAERSIHLIRQLLAFARKQVIEPQILDLNSIVAEMLKMLKRLIGADIELVWDPEEKLWSIEMDPHQVDQVMANLSVNSRDAIERTGRVTIRTRNKVVNESQSKKLRGIVPGEYVLLSVADTGRGMDKETIRKAFEPFFTTKPEGVGTGLGLSTVYGIIKQNHGFIYAFSKPGGGARFDIYLPRYTGEKKIFRGHQKTGGIPGGNESILLVDDEKSILGVMEHLLLNLGYDLTATDSPLEALRILRENPEKFDLLITDKIMPVMRGRELKDEVRKIRPDLKYLFMSGHRTDDLEDWISVEEQEPFLQKPFTQKELAFMVREVLESSGKQD